MGEWRGDSSVAQERAIRVEEGGRHHFHARSCGDIGNDLECRRCEAEVAMDGRDKSRSGSFGGGALKGTGLDSVAQDAAQLECHALERVFDFTSKA